jgi:uncharacterized protein (DUF3084 family)
MQPKSLAPKIRSVVCCSRLGLVVSIRDSCILTMRITLPSVGSQPRIYIRIGESETAVMAQETTAGARVTELEEQSKNHEGHRANFGAECRRKEAQLTTKEEQLSLQEEELDTKAAALESREVKVAQREARLDHRTMDLSEAEDKLKGKKAKLAERENTLVNNAWALQKQQEE